jgi:cyanophycinase-like exopeptidase
LQRLIAHSICLILVVGAKSAAEPAFEHFVAGNPADVDRPTVGLVVMQGGGTDVDPNYERMGDAAGGGDFLVLRASGGDEYNDYVLALCGCDSVETLVFHERSAAYDPFVTATIRRAEALFIAGGDQSRYVRFWKDTPVADAINDLARRPAPIGGTSAGMAVLGEFVYSAMSDESLTAEVALADPFHEDVTLARGFLSAPRLEGIITDQHLQERNRIGRTLALLARLRHDGWADAPRAIAADRETALHIDPETGRAEVLATPAHETPFVYFLRAREAPAVCEPGTPLTLRNVEVYRIGPGGTFDLEAWSGAGGIGYTLTVEKGVLSSSRGDVY